MWKQIVGDHVVQIQTKITIYFGIAQNLHLTGMKVSISQIIISFDVLTIYLITIATNIQSTADKYLMRILLVGGKKALTRECLQPDTPFLEDLLTYLLFL